MKFLFFVVFLPFILVVGCSSDEAIPVEEVVQSYDTLELRYQQFGDMAMELMSNISVDSQIKTQFITDMLERQPVVSLDFRKPVTTRKDILAFVKYQQKIDSGVRRIFSQLETTPKWQSAPLILDFKSRYERLRDSIEMAKTDFNLLVKDAKLDLAVPLDSARLRYSSKPLP
jgi:hypothetical protein